MSEPSQLADEIERIARWGYWWDKEPTQDEARELLRRAAAALRAQRPEPSQLAGLRREIFNTMWRAFASNKPPTKDEVWEVAFELGALLLKAANALRAQPASPCCVPCGIGCPCICHAQAPLPSRAFEDYWNGIVGGHTRADWASDLSAEEIARDAFEFATVRGIHP